jgi:cell division initiation protein
MKITPLDIKQKEFNKEFRGYVKEDVDAFLKSLATEWEKMLTELKSTSTKLELAEREVSRLKEVESSLFKTIKNAEDTGANMIDFAQKQADLHLREAKINAEYIMNEARTRAQALLEDAECDADAMAVNAKNKLESIEKELKDLVHRREDVIRQLRSLGESLLQKVEIESNVQIDFSKSVDDIVKEKEKENKQVVQAFKDKANAQRSSFIDQKESLITPSKPLSLFESTSHSKEEISKEEFDMPNESEVMTDESFEITEEEISEQEHAHDKKVEEQKIQVEQPTKKTSGDGSFFDSI